MKVSLPLWETCSFRKFFCNAQQELSKLPFLAAGLWLCLALLRRLWIHHPCEYTIAGDCSYIAFGALLSARINPTLSTSPHIFPNESVLVDWGGFLSSAVSNPKKCLCGSLRGEGCSIRIPGGKRGRELAFFPFCALLYSKIFCFHGHQLNLQT